MAVIPPSAKTRIGRADNGFTLIELSIVLVIIGLIVGGILTGRDLIKAAEVRATITQVEKFNQAANTFYGKYGSLPGDLNQQVANQFGFQARGTARGQGDGNGILEGGTSFSGYNGFNQVGENVMFWVDLSSVNLINGTFSTATATNGGQTGYTSPYITGSLIDSYLPAAKLGYGNYFYVFSGGWADNGGTSNAQNYFGLAGVASIGMSSCPTCLSSQPTLTVQQAQGVDQKIDDGLPTSGTVLSSYIWSNNWCWGQNADHTCNAAAPTSAISGSITSCFDNGGISGATQQYSMEENGGTGVNCALTFKMQAGD